MQEMRAIRDEIIDCCRMDPMPFRRVNGTDSNVCLGAWAKGRSSSFQLNGSMRKTVGWQVLGNKCLVNFRVDTKLSPSGDPSRDVPLRAPKRAPAWAKQLLVPSLTPKPDAELLPWELRSALEATLGKPACPKLCSKRAY